LAVRIIHIVMVDRMVRRENGSAATGLRHKRWYDRHGNFLGAELVE
jgi:hypothetical protein